MNKIALIILIFSFTIASGILFLSQKSYTDTNLPANKNIEFRDGIQYISINALGDYSPRLSKAKANMPTKLIIKTSGTYDCSRALVIPANGYQKILPQSGEEIINLGTPGPGKIHGLCSMGMYNFTLDFK